MTTAPSPEAIALAREIAMRDLIGDAEVAYDDLSRVDSEKIDRSANILLPILRELAALRQQRDAAIAALREVQAWRGTHDRKLDAIERAAEMFYRDTGFLAPGKAYPLGMEYDDEKRRAAWNKWVERKNAELDAKIAAVLADADAREEKS